LLDLFQVTTASNYYTYSYIFLNCACLYRFAERVMQRDIIAE